MGDGVDTSIGNLGKNRGWCSNVASGLENHWYEELSNKHQNSCGFKSDKQQKRDSYNDYLKKVVK